MLLTKEHVFLYTRTFDVANLAQYVLDHIVYMYVYVHIETLLRIFTSALSCTVHPSHLSRTMVLVIETN